MDGEEPVLKVDRIEPMAEKSKVKLKGSLEILLGSGSPPISELQSIFRSHPGNSAIRFVFFDPNNKQKAMRAGPGWRVGLTSELLDNLNKLLGPEGRAVAAADSKPAPKATGPKWAKVNS
jgi:hypothetical protein